ncbi:hypothetical protein JCM10908_002476 [Rhodotorula pacifica]|uniref:uncharacterized protein n=1 Tax=Rhodotorula pacifica TaxID=1495444 RepID=UPI003177EC53
MLLPLTLVNCEWQEVCEPIADGGRPLAPLIEDLLAPSKRLETLQNKVFDRDKHDDLANTLDQLRPFVRGVRKLNLTANVLCTPNVLQVAARLLEACSDLRDLCLGAGPFLIEEDLEAYATFNRGVFALSTLRRLEIWRFARDVGSSLQLYWPQLSHIKLCWITLRNTSPSESARALHLFLQTLSKSLVSICVYWACDSPIDSTVIPPSSMVAFPCLASFIQLFFDSDVLFLIDPATPIRRLEYDNFSHKNFVAAENFSFAQPIKTLAAVVYKTSELYTDEETDFRAWEHRYSIKVNGAVPAGANDAASA